MKCYHHSLIDAVGICRQCYKGLCQDCCQQRTSDAYLSCCEACDKKVAEVEEINERAKMIYGIGAYAQPAKFPVNVWLSFCLGILFSFLGIYDVVQAGGDVSAFNLFFACTGMTFFIFSLKYFKRAKKLGLIV